jgi:PadR family transcriptional regulator PadR
MTMQTLSLLSIMLSDPFAEWYGLELSRASGVKTGTLYPTLARLEEARWLASAWEEIDPALEGRPRRRLYRLTGEGADAARMAVDEAMAKINASHRQRRTRSGLRPGELPT